MSNTGPIINPKPAEQVDDAKKTKHCTERCRNCTTCICKKSNEFCSTNCGFFQKHLCSNLPKDEPGFPLPGWTYDIPENFHHDIIEEDPPIRNCVESTTFASNNIVQLLLLVLLVIFNPQI